MMTREEAIEELDRLLSHWDELENGKRSFRWYSKTALEVALSALRPVRREQVEKVWRGEWIHDPDTGYEYCDRCAHTICLDDYLNRKSPLFCEMCGDAKTDEAVEMVMERMEALKDV